MDNRSREGSPEFWWDGADHFGKTLVKDRIDRAMLYSRARRVGAQVVAIFPVSFRPNRPGTKPAAAIRANIVQLLHAGPAESALKGANHRLGRIGRERDVAVFASGS